VLANAYNASDLLHIKEIVGHCTGSDI
jgi:hypothetical protein